MSRRGDTIIDLGRCSRLGIDVGFKGRASYWKIGSRDCWRRGSPPYRGKGQQKVTVEHVHVHEGARRSSATSSTPGEG
jgi:hypothetical protein